MNSTMYISCSTVADPMHDFAYIHNSLSVRLVTLRVTSSKDLVLGKNAHYSNLLL